MSKAIEAYGKVDEITKDSNYRFNVDEVRYSFEFKSKPKLSKDGFISRIRRISKDWSYEERTPILFASKGKNVLHIDIATSGKLIDFLIHDTITVSGFTISRKCEEAKKLADYMLDLFKSEE